MNETFIISVIDIRECATQPCTRGYCMEGDNGFTCICPYGYAGDLCEIGKE